ncbi:hypothetical protein [Gordonia shandongensis]|uniref:hypothetical protein n=1 Tax=Gordonia shandongensis TaxID=376351 RepID=UPI00041E2766|nr:hypothetical protein [Gordonia shandongensis]
MDALLGFIGSYWWLVFVFGGSIGGAVRAVTAWNERRSERRLEKFRLKQEARIAAAEATGRGRIDAEALRRDLARCTAEHRAADDRWFAYETDLATVIDYPMLIDMREPLTAEFHRARTRAELLRPTDDELSADAAAADAVAAYRDAVHEYRAALEVAEAEARRRRRGDFAPAERERLARARRLLDLASDDGASPEERQAAYARARRELDGLIDLPAAGTAALEHRLRSALEGPPGNDSPADDSPGQI